MEDNCIIDNVSVNRPNYLYIVTFLIKSTNKKGCAVVYAYDANHAVQLLKADGLYNGSSHEYEIYKIEEIIKPKEQMLVCEQINE